MHKTELSGESIRRLFIDLDYLEELNLLLLRTVDEVRTYFILNYAQIPDFH